MFTSPPPVDVLLRILILGPVALLWVLFLVRMIGLRAFSKMAAFDFVITVATGSLLANAAVASNWLSYLQSLGAITMLLAFQTVIARLRKDHTTVEELADNRGRLLYREGEFCREAMAEERVTESDLWGKMREANVLDRSEVRAIVLENTGDISVLHGENLSEELLSGLRK